ncbi:MAG TPA: ABC transporter ATP-binding protein [Gemmataceae bacterium]|jgi:ABC-2 type transport system ATP-binding protein
MDNIIATHGLTKIFGGKIVVNRLNLSVPQGSIFALLGGNGAGKSTTIRMLTGLLPSDGGSARILGEDCWSAAIELRHRVGYVPEKPRFYDWMTVREIGWFTAGFHKDGFFRRYVELVQRFRLDPAARLRTLSKGGYAKVGLALALASDPDVLILDEPTSGLDLFIRREFLASMVELAGAGRTILLSSHGIAEVERVASHVGFMAEGRLLLAASIEELRKRIVRVRLRFEGPIPDPACLGTVLEFETSGRLWQAVLQDPDRAALEELRGYDSILDMEETPLSLEEMYTALLVRFHRPDEEEISRNGEHVPPYAQPRSPLERDEKERDEVIAPSGVERRRAPLDREEDQP